MKSLAQFPQRGRVVPEFSDESIREIIVGAYRIVYRIDYDRRLIEIVRFWHAGRGIPEIFA
jgi:plasmid stabilization system protein ParE